MPVLVASLFYKDLNFLAMWQYVHIPERIVPVMPNDTKYIVTALLEKSVLFAVFWMSV